MTLLVHQEDALLEDPFGMLIFMALSIKKLSFLDHHVKQTIPVLLLLHVLIPTIHLTIPDMIQRQLILTKDTNIEIELIQILQNGVNHD